MIKPQSSSQKSSHTLKHEVFVPCLSHFNQTVKQFGQTLKYTYTYSKCLQTWFKQSMFDSLWWCLRKCTTIWVCLTNKTCDSGLPNILVCSNMFDVWCMTVSDQLNFGIFCTSHRYKVYSRDQHVLKNARLFYFCEVGFSLIYTLIYFSFHFVAIFWTASCL